MGHIGFPGLEGSKDSARSPFGRRCTFDGPMTTLPDGSRTFISTSAGSTPETVTGKSTSSPSGDDRIARLGPTGVTVGSLKISTTTGNVAIGVRDVRLADNGTSSSEAKEEGRDGTS